MTITWRDYRRGQPFSARRSGTMAEIVNLRHARKAKGRADKDRAAEVNRAKFGTAKSERDLAKARSEKASRDLESSKLEDK